MPHARDDLLADIAAFLEIDAVQQVEIGVMGKGVAVGEIDAALGHAERDAKRLVFARRAPAPIAGRLGARQDRAPAEPRRADRA